MAERFCLTTSSNLAFFCTVPNLAPINALTQRIPIRTGVHIGSPLFRSISDFSPLLVHLRRVGWGKGYLWSHRPQYGYEKCFGNLNFYADWSLFGDVSRAM